MFTNKKAGFLGIMATYCVLKNKVGFLAICCVFIRMQVLRVGFLVMCYVLDQGVGYLTTCCGEVKAIFYVGFFGNILCTDTESRFQITATCFKVIFLRTSFVVKNEQVLGWFFRNVLCCVVEGKYDFIWIVFNQKKKQVNN
eukprot:TRINITY_DN6937_c0_g1_i5.p3 TRINITY_DN6937_c0_g1~~TRINITY_DN6937_c0_g1_i5.p3  ORF type:complete len:141 (-),score=7.65 TRINITY_DN6937_c0_g1_i5:104-526(-)